METVTLRAEDFRTVHNTLCDLRSVVGDMERSLVKVERLEQIIAGFEQGLADAYRQDHSAFESKHDYYREYQRGHNLRAIWSVFELPVGGFNQVDPFKDAIQLAYTDHWGDEPVFEEIKGPTWGDLYRAADAAIRRSGDDHHCFIESFRINPKEPTQLILGTGS